jgi:hypothetical protein
VTAFSDSILIDDQVFFGETDADQGSFGGKICDIFSEWDQLGSVDVGVDYVFDFRFFNFLVVLRVLRNEFYIIDGVFLVVLCRIVGIEASFEAGKNFFLFDSNVTADSDTQS